MSFNCSSVKSGAIFKKIGRAMDRLERSAIRVSSSRWSGSFSCNSRKPGVLGELTLTTK